MATPQTLSELLRIFIDHSEGEIRRLRKEIDAATRALSCMTDTPPLIARGSTMGHLIPEPVSPLTLAALSGSAAFGREYTDWPASLSAQYSEMVANVGKDAGIGDWIRVDPLCCPVCRYGPLWHRADDVLVCKRALDPRVRHNGPWLFDLYERSTYRMVYEAERLFPQHMALAFSQP